jgi:hypothetical protein
MQEKVTALPTAGRRKALSISSPALGLESFIVLFLRQQPARQKRKGEQKRVGKGGRFGKYGEHKRLERLKRREPRPPKITRDFLKKKLPRG